ncbi:integrator complex subunit 1 [Tribolium castaneum]|uniref:Integrator complex subunit 1-like Protein n=1 Tax=Tribolium castaneum TaxID=7070 RepID=D6WAZ1_TRICA|nr:PREDICTED: integrator complex subunit 1 [Tribolium castaneum]EEZ98703.1 Integrator complex subunit 1-like Protein [Tribolium castaneum]|eukprot:XP_971265.1 PREDICTED: integrator complex subunit 1 [Tribolium castaneum]
MDRNKPGQSQATRGPKAKITQQPPDLFIALGAKQSSPRDDPKRSVPLPKTSTASHLQTSSSKVTDKLKREGTSSSLTVPPSKKMKVAIPGSRPGPSTSSILPVERMGVEPWEALAVDCETSDLFESIMAAVNAGNTDKAVGYVLGVIRSLKTQRTKICKVVYLSLLLTCSCKPQLFTNENIIAAIVNVLRRDVTSGFKGVNKTNSYFHMLFINLLTHAFTDVAQWPEIFVKIYVEDAVADRIFIDNPYCKPFVDNIITAFNTKLPPSSLLKSETWNSTARDTSSPLTITSADDDTKSEVILEHKAAVENWNVKVYPRFTQTQENVEKIVLEAIKEQLARRQQPETITKNFVRFLSIASGLVEIRIIAVSRIESWLHNHKLMKSAQELLAYLCYNCSASSQRDLEIIAQLSKLRLKNKPMVNYFNNCLREMVYSFPENLYPLLKYTIYNELSNARNSNNLIVVGALFQVAPEASADAFADICLELLLNKDDYLRSLRALLKEITRVLRHDFNLLSIVHSLVRERKEFANNVRESEFRERIFLSLADLVCMCMLLCVSPQVRDASTQNKRDVTVLKAFQKQVSNIQREAVTWLNDSALRVFRPSLNDFHHVLLKVLFLEQAEHYYKVDSWPGENERNLFLRLTSEVPLLQATLLRILLIGNSKEHPISPTEAIEISDQLIRRAANLPQDCAPPLVVDNLEIIGIYFNLCSYNYPENITLPAGYVPPSLAISGLYWKVWLILLIIAAHNPVTFGNEVWNKYPTLRMFMEMCITNHFSFPPPTMTSLDEDYQSREQQILALEKQKILEFESHLAAASTKMEITEQSSLLLPQLMELRPEGEARRPPQAVLDQLQHLNNTHRMGHLLCRSRNPDFLLDIMSRQGGTAHMPWLAELVHNSEGALAHLPVQCLCEYLLSTTPTEKLTKHGQLLAHLRTVVNENDPQTACEVLEYLFRRLTSDHGASRTQATKGLNLILAEGEESETNNTNWLTSYITHFPHFTMIKPVLIQFLRQALQIETNPARVSSYINFLATQDCNDSFTELHELIADLSSVIIERHSVASYVLPGPDNQTLKHLLTIFASHIQKAQEFSEDIYSSVQNYSEYVLVTWVTGEQCHMQTLVIHAAIVLLTYGPLENFEPFETLLNFWFPANAEQPQAYTPDTNERTSYLPDWMKLRMIRSNVPRLVDAAIEKLEPPKLVLFIQSFGIPTNSISKLLSTLDKATLLDPKLVVDSVLDKTYMIQLVEVQNKRGAVGGDTFVKAIEMQMPVVQDIDVKIEIESKKQLPNLVKTQQIVTNSGDIINLLNNIFSPNYGGSKDRDIVTVTKMAFEKQSLDVIFNYLKSLPMNFIAPVLHKHNSISTLFRLLFSSKDHLIDKITMATVFLNHMTDVHNITYSVLRQFLNENDQKVKTEEQGERKLVSMISEAKTQEEKTDMMVDWLSTIQLEVAYSQKQLKEDLLFSRDNLPFRPLLMSLVLQRASWQSLHVIMNYLLKEDNSDICPVSALDFLCALTQSPKLWQGRDKAIPKHHHSEDVFDLGKDKALILVGYILEESKQNQANWSKKMESRLVLLLQCIRNCAPEILGTLLEKSDCDTHCRELLLMIYMSLPYSGQDLINSKDNISKQAYAKNCTSSADEISHCLLSALAATPRSKDWPRKSQDLELCARKLAATHPVLVLRQLPMLAGSLKGRAQYDWGVLKNRGHLLLFGQVLGLLELLEPIVFEQSRTLCDILDSYFLLLQYHGHMKDLSVLVQRIITFIQNWMTNDIKAASRYLQEHGSVLLDIQMIQPGVRPLLSNVTLPVGDSSTPPELLVRTAMSPMMDPLPPHWSQLLTAIQTSENLNILQELDHITNKKPHLLETPSQHLYNYISSSSGAVRSLALTLIVRWLKFNPNAASDALPVILTCLDSRNGDVVASVLDRLSDLVSVMQEYGKVILTRVFQLGMESTLNTTSNITKSIDLLNLQSGC